MYYKKIGGFELRAFFDKERNELVNKVTYRRKAIQTQVLDDRFSQSYIGYKLIVADLNSVLSWGKIVTHLLDKKEVTTEDKAILHSLFISMVTTYWKCFADTKGRNGVQLNDKLVPKSHTLVHRELRRIRHNFAAHSGGDPFESGYILHVKDIAGKNRFEPFTIPIHRKANHGDKKLTSNIIELTTLLIQCLETKQEKILEQIKKNQV
ncbi:hypothetical protein [Shewanella baltica]|uniref:hypothetical protein n=1 Tax=Shewanella baltica TaxID=62322 RepID=UPI0024BA67F5|nr:hypothetical protein [Shewanella baltica]